MASPYEIPTNHPIPGVKQEDKFIPENDSSFLMMAMRETQTTPDELMTLFFSKTNVDYLQERIQSEVKKVSGRDIVRQPDTALLQVMITKYQEARPGVSFNSFSILNMIKPSTKASIKDRLFSLNKAVLQPVVGGIISEMTAYMTHLKYLDRLPETPSMPQWATSYGGNELVHNIGFSDGKEESRSNSSYAFRNALMPETPRNIYTDPQIYQ